MIKPVKAVTIKTEQIPYSARKSGFVHTSNPVVVDSPSNLSLEGTLESIEKSLEEMPTAGRVPNPLLRMKAELLRALGKPVDQRRWIMVIDLRKCVGCHACTIACAIENKLPPGVVYRQVVEEEVGKYPNVAMRFVPRPCLQCANPPCVSVCPVGATTIRPDGVVDMNYRRCIGCRYCMIACPYNSRYFDFGFSQLDEIPSDSEAVLGKQGAEVIELLPTYEYGRERLRQREKSPIGNVRKCHFCLHRLEAGQLPACVATCIGHATLFGDANDPESLVSELIARPNVMRLREELGTEPQVYYLV
jgi:Fe-S-cluster-containing dehydrogenase component